MSRRQMSALDRPTRILLISGNRSRPLSSPGDSLAYNSLPASWVPSNTTARRDVCARALGEPWLLCMTMTGVLYVIVGLMVWPRSCPRCWMSSICENPCSKKRFTICALCNMGKSWREMDHGGNIEQAETVPNALQYLWSFFQGKK